MDDIIYNSLRLSLAILSFADKSQGLSFEKFECEKFQTELNCTVGNSIDDINITFHHEQNDCSLTNDVYKETTIPLDSASYPSCIGHNSCVLTDKIVNVSNSVADKTRKIFIQYHCVRTSNQNHNKKKPQIVCPFNMESVACGSPSRKIEIQSVELIPSLSFCEKQIMNNSCTEMIHQKVNTSCNGKQKCKPLIWNESVFTLDDCIRIPKLFNISFSCVKAIPTVLPLQGENNVEEKAQMTNII
ncbi:uncharacterized protein LOC127710065 isoform X2 [Mytilus californianus]|uniref:uncharacterized protein LOC127710065 isoform X2 n=1 Tax=Mytilus californianus TaxID=6549 RepID=UPI00224666C6|nr:uncharacterized protein LOC127710065 isoform X2 [Mytilus californianus]